MIGAIVLAAGRSSRMGRPKASLPIGATTFLGRVLGTLADAEITEVRVVLGPDAGDTAARHGLAPPALVINPRPEDGMLSSVRLGMAALPDGIDGFLVWPVDHPVVRRETVTALVETFSRLRAPVVLPRHAGRRGHPVLFAMRLREEILAARDDVGARGVVHAHEEDVTVVEVDDAGVVDDIDTPGDYARLTGRPVS